MIATGKKRPIATRTALNNETQVNTFDTVKISPAKTYAKNEVKQMIGSELKKNALKAPWNKFILRNHMSSVLQCKNRQLIGA